MPTPLISIVIPAYNAENTLAACLQSIVASVGSDQDTEIICVNDGSKDGTGKLSNEFALENPIVKPVHKQNGGASSARNAGLDAAKGTYVMFGDADDEYRAGTIGYIREDIGKYAPDYIAFKRETISLSGSVTQWSYHSSCGVLDMTWDEYLNQYMPYKGHTHVVFNKVYKREIIENNHIRFDTSLLFMEDGLFNLLFLEKARVLYEDMRAGYLQNKTRGSIISTGWPDFYEQITKCIRLIQREYPELAEKVKPMITISYIQSAELAARRILTGRDMPPEGKKQAIRKIMNDPAMRCLEKDFDYSQCEYLHRQMNLLLNNNVLMYKLRYITMPNVLAKIKKLIH